MDIELRHFRCFLAIAEQANITKAAATLFMTQPALSRTLRQLEERVGVRLVDRSTRHLALTPEGEAFRRKAELAIAAVDDALNVAELRTRPLRVGHAWSAIGEHTEDLLARWADAHPHELLELRRIDGPSAGLSSGRSDVAILRVDLHDSNLHCELLYEEPRLAAVPVDHPLASAESLTLDELTALPIVVNTVSGTTTVDLWTTPPATIEVSNADDWLMVIASGKGAGVTPTSTRSMYIHSKVAYVPLDSAPPVRVFLAWRKDNSHPATADFVALARQVITQG